MTADSPRIEPETVLCDAYRVERWLGSGGYGDVYRAVALRIGRTVALKVLRSGRGRDEGALARFRREAQIATRLEHPHTVRLLDFTAMDDGTPILVWEYLPGETLAARLERTGPMPPSSVARLARGVLGSLEEAHRAGIVHRDIKPSNLMLCDFAGEQDFVKVLDFGVAKDLTGTHGDLTGEGEVLGTPRYMAPEQVLAKPVAPATDLYALGLVMAECLTGVPVIAGTSKTRSVALQGTESDLELDPAVLAGPLGDTIRRATRKRVGARYPSAGSMRDALEGLPADPSSRPDPDATRSLRPSEPTNTHASTGAPVSMLRGQSSGARPASQGRSGRVLVVTGGMIALSLAAGVGVSFARPWRYFDAGSESAAVVSPSAPSQDTRVDAGAAPFAFALPELSAHAENARWHPPSGPVPPGIDLSDFDALGFLPVATARARELLADAALTKLAVDGVWHGDRVDLVVSKTSARYWFRSPLASARPSGYPSNVEYQGRCTVLVNVDERGFHARVPLDTCEAPFVASPRCSPSQVLKRFAGTVEAIDEPYAVTLMYDPGNAGGILWHAVAGEAGHAYLADDCR